MVCWPHALRGAVEAGNAQFALTTIAIPLFLRGGRIITTAFPTTYPGLARHGKLRLHNGDWAAPHHTHPTARPCLPLARRARRAARAQRQCGCASACCSSRSPRLFHVNVVALGPVYTPFQPGVRARWCVASLLRPHAEGCELRQAAAARARACSLPSSGSSFLFLASSRDAGGFIGQCNQRCVAARSPRPRLIREQSNSEPLPCPDELVILQQG